MAQRQHSAMAHDSHDRSELLPGPFISYSRQDLGFARKLYDALRQRNRDAWVDLEGIAPSEEWLQKLYAAIDSTQAFVFIISDASVASPYCEEEIRRATEANKKLIPILYRQVAAERQPPALAKLQWISFQDEAHFEARVDDLVRALDTDLEWINEHTRLLVRAREWEREQRDKSYLLRGKDLKDAEQWLLASAQAKDRQPTALQSTFIGASAEAQKRSRNRLLAGVAAAAIAAGVLAVWAFYQRNQAQINERQAVSRLLAAQATGGMERDLNLSLLLAVAAYQRAPTFEARQALRGVIEARPHLAKYFYGLSQRVQRLMFDSSATLLASSSTDGMVIVWNTATGKEIFRSQGNGKSAPAIAISAEAKLLAIASDDGKVRLRDLPGGKPLDELVAEEKSRLTAAAFSPDGRWLAWGGDAKTITVLNVQTRRRQCVSADLHKTPLTAVRFAPDGRSLAAMDYSGTAVVWHTESCREHATLDSTGGGSFAAISDDLHRTASTDAGFPEVHVANVIDRSAKRLEIPNSDFLLAIDFHRSGEFLALGVRDGRILFWEPNSGKIRQTLRGHRTDVTSVAFGPSGQNLASGSIHGEVILWDLDNTRPMESIRVLRQPAAASVFFAGSDERLLAMNQDGKIHAWNLNPAKSAPLNVSWSAPAAEVTASANGALVAGRIGDRIAIHATQDGSKVDEIVLPSSSETPLVFSPDNRRLAFAAKGDAYLRDIEKRATSRVGATTNDTVALAFTPAGEKLVFTARDRGLAWFDRQSGQTADFPVAGHISYIRSIAVSPDGRILATGGGMYDGRILLWSVADGRLLRVIQPNDPTDVARMFFSQDGQTLATVTAFSNMLRLWDVASGRLASAPMRLAESLKWVTAAFSPNGKFLATVQKDGIALHDLDPANWLKAACRAANRSLTTNEWRDYAGFTGYQPTCPELAAPK